MNSISSIMTSLSSSFFVGTTKSNGDSPFFAFIASYPVFPDFTIETINLSYNTSEQEIWIQSKGIISETIQTSIIRMTDEMASPKDVIKGGKTQTVKYHQGIIQYQLGYKITTKQRLVEEESLIVQDIAIPLTFFYSKDYCTDIKFSYSIRIKPEND